MKHLTEAEFLATFGEPMRPISTEAEPPCDFWGYLEGIPITDFEGHDCSQGTVTYAWNDFSGRYQHVLVDSTDKKVFMVLVLDLEQRVVFGHRLLNLNREYGIKAD